jgi:hypothetical protein
MINAIEAIAAMALVTALVGCAGPSGLEKTWPMGPGPGDVYREYTYARRWGEVDPNATNEGAAEMIAHARAPKRVAVRDMDKARGAEVSVQYWGGHIGTSEQAFTVNGGEPFAIPQPAGTPTAAQTYNRTIVGDNPLEVPLSDLHEGVNTFEFRAGPQIKYGFNWGFYWVYSFTTRVYYDRSKPHVGGRIVSPEPGATIGDGPTFTAEVDAPPEQIRQVDFIALHEDYDWEGNGLYRQWHWQYVDGQIAHHVGTATAPPYSVTWDTEWVPDQDQPVSVMARIVAADGTMCMTPAVEGLRLVREGRSVKMYKATRVPENFGVRVGNKKACALDVPEDLAAAKRAKIVLSTWSAAHAEQIGLNDTVLVERVGKVHDYSFDEIPVPLDILGRRNRFFEFSTTEEHASEINWPGPALLIEFGK